jgi:hypothetical protein
MRRHFLWLALCTSLGLSACATGRPPAPTAPLDAAKACAAWRWIGVSRSGAQCPAVPGWTVRPLFPQLASIQPPECPGDKPPLKGVPDPELIRELNRFCVYEIAEPKRLMKRLPPPPTTSPDLVRIDQDCAGLSLSERYLEARSWKAAPDPEELLAQAGKPREPLPIDGQRGVRLAFLDTQPTFEDVPLHQGRSPHGFTLAKIAQELVCAPAPKEPEPYKHCAAQITTRLALPILEFNAKDSKANRIDLERGGFLGMQSDLAVAIRQEVDRWLAQRTERSQRHLVLNLSLAWNGQLFGGLTGEQIAEMKAGTQAVYRALQYAAGFDVLVLAAAGNQQLEPCLNFGPLLPAAWEEGTPLERDCDTPEQPPARLLYAVGGLQADGTPLANARPGGMPQRAAYGKTKVFEGSSVATAIVSSIAAVVWDTFPHLSSQEVMAYLDRSQEDLRVRNDPLALQADFWFHTRDPITLRVNDEAPPPVRRLSLCAALTTACQENPCPPLPDCGERLSPPRRSLVPPSEPGANRGSCAPWTLPQPAILPCPACEPPVNN